jgi:hypothetical protein
MSSSLRNALAATSFAAILAASILAVVTPAVADDYEEGWKYSHADNDYGDGSERPGCRHQHESRYIDHSADDDSEPCSFTYQPVTDGWGNVVSYRQVRTCE